MHSRKPRQMDLRRAYTYLHNLPIGLFCDVPLYLSYDTLMSALCSCAVLSYGRTFGTRTYRSRSHLVTLSRKWSMMRQNRLSMLIDRLQAFMNNNIEILSIFVCHLDFALISTRVRAAGGDNDRTAADEMTQDSKSYKARRNRRKIDSPSL